MSQHTTYPNLPTMMAADFATLCAWRRHLPAPQTDVQRTVRRRIEKRWGELRPREAPRRQEQSFGDVFEDLFKGKAWRP